MVPVAEQDEIHPRRPGNAVARALAAGGGLVLVLAVTGGCQADERATKRTPAASPSPSGLATDAEARAAAGSAYDEALERMLDEETIEFRYDSVLVGTAMMEIVGTADLDRQAWVVESLATDPTNDEEHAWRAVSVGGKSWMQMSGWPESEAGCWLELGPGEVPLAVLGLPREEPAWLGMLGQLEIVGSRIEDESVLVAELPLGEAMVMMTGRALLTEMAELPKAELTGRQVRLFVTLREGSLVSVEMEGAYFEKAVARAGGDFPADIRAGLRRMTTTVSFPDDQTPRSPTAPEPALRMLASEPGGCRDR